MEKGQSSDLSMDIALTCSPYKNFICFKRLNNLTRFISRSKHQKYSFLKKKHKYV